jgi:hypothetical protein
MGLLDPPLKLENPNIKKLRDTLVDAYRSPARAELIANSSV